MFSIRAATTADAQAIRGLISAVLGEYGLGLDRCGTDRDLEDVPHSYTRRGGLFEVIVDEDGNIAGTVGLYPLDETTCELRKMYFDRSMRGKGFGKSVLDRMIRKALTAGFVTMHLETASVLTEAIGLYLSFGFIERIGGSESERCDRVFSLELNTYDAQGQLRALPELTHLDSTERK